MLSISGNGGSSQSASVASVEAPRAAAQARGKGASGVAGADEAKFSETADVLATLDVMKRSDPDKFQATMKGIADDLRSQAKTQGGAAGKELEELADKVTQAAATGDLASLASTHHDRPEDAPPGGPPRGGAPPHGAAAAHPKKPALRDPADANRDGKVSSAERQAYAKKKASAQGATKSDAATKAEQSAKAEQAAKAAQSAEVEKAAAK